VAASAAAAATNSPAIANAAPRRGARRRALPREIRPPDAFTVAPPQSGLSIWCRDDRCHGGFRPRDTYALARPVVRCLHYAIEPRRPKGSSDVWVRQDQP